MSNGEVTTVGIPSLFGLTGTKQAFQDEGILLGEAQTVNFVGDGVTATLAAGVLTVQIDGGGSSINLITTIEEVTELDVTSAITPSVIYDLDLLKADLDSPVFTGTPTAPTPQTEPSPDNSTKLATTAFVNVVANAAVSTANSYADSLLTSVYQFQSTYNPQTTGNFPTTANTVGGVDIAKCFTWVIAGLSGQYTFRGVTVDNGDTLLSLVDNASATVSSDWHITEKNLGYTPENLNNKATNLTLPNDTKYPTTKAIVDNVLNILLTDYTVAPVNSVVSATDSSLTAFGKLQKQITDAVANAVSLSALRYVVTTPTIVANAYTVVSTDVNAYGNKILKLTNPTTIAVTLPNPSALTPPASIGDSFNIRQGGAGGITITGSITGVNIMSIQHTTITLIAESPTSWMSVGG
jgi:hypothetical protein